MKICNDMEWRILIDLCNNLSHGLNGMVESNPDREPRLFVFYRDHPQFAVLRISGDASALVCEHARPGGFRYLRICSISDPDMYQTASSKVSELIQTVAQLCRRAKDMVEDEA